MRALVTLLALVVVGLAGAAAGYRLAGGSLPPLPWIDSAISERAQAAIGPVLYWRDPDGKPFFSAGPKRTADSRDFVAVLDAEEPDFQENATGKRTQARAGGERKILYYRNPMGLPDTSPVPKKDSMGMDYIPVYDGEAADDGSAVQVSLGRIQRSGVRTQPVERRVLARPVLVPGAVRIDERRIKVVALRMDGFIEDLFVNATGQTVRAGQPLFRVYSPQVQQAQVDLLTALREQDRSGPGAEAQRRLEGPIQRLRNLGIPEARIREVVDKRSNPRTIDWPSPSSGVVLEKRVIDGQRAVTGDELYRIADLMAVWVIAEVPERELAFLRVGDPASVTFLAYPGDVREGRLTFVYPDVNPETRTVRVRIELPNPDGRLKLDMYADVTLQAGAGDAAAIAVPESALIDSGTRQVVIVARGDGRFEPRPVKTGRRGDGHVEITEGLAEGEEVVTTATFLIDAESNLQAALRALTAPEARR